MNEVKTIGEVERIVHASGLWDGSTPVEFSNDGEAWSESWAPSDEHPFPSFARVETYRKEVRLPARVTIRWDEQIPMDEEWHRKWCTHPMQHFGRTARMIAFRQAFRDLLGDIHLEDEPVSQPDRDWVAEIEAAESLEALNVIVSEARDKRALTGELERLFKSHRRAFAPVESKPRRGLAVGPKAAAKTEPSAEQLAKLEEKFPPAHKPSPAMFAGKKR